MVKEKTSLLIILAIAGIVVASIGGYFWWQKRCGSWPFFDKNIRCELGQRVDVSIDKNVLIQNKAVKTENWKTYNGSLNVFYNGHTSYSFRYPSDWDLKQENLNNYKYLVFNTSGGKSGRFVIDASGRGGPVGPIRTIKEQIKDYPTGKVAISEIEAINEKTILGTYGFLADEKTGARYFWFESSYPTNYSSNFSEQIDSILGSFKLL